MATKPTAPKQFTTVDPYKQYQTAYKAQQNAVAAANTAQTQAKASRESQAKDTLANSNRGVNTTYQNAINPYGSAASQMSGASSAVSAYGRNASYGTYLKGLGANQANYTQEMNNSNQLWQNWLADKAAQEAANAGDYADKMAAQGNADRTFNYNQYRDNMADYQWQTQFDYGKERDKVADDQWKQEFDRSGQQWQTQFEYQKARDDIADKQRQQEFDEDVRRFDLNYALDKKAAGGYGGGGGGGRSGGGGGSNGGYDFGDMSGLYGWYDGSSPSGSSYRHEQNGTKNSKKPNITKVEHKASGVKGKKYKITYYSDGTKKYDLVNA